MAAYHLEALRRQRVIDRKQEALTRLSILQKEEEQRLQEAFERREREKRNAEENLIREREKHLRQCGHDSVKNKQCQVRLLTQDDLRHQQKILRDHGLVMGYVNDKFLS